MRRPLSDNVRNVIEKRSWSPGAMLCSQFQRLSPEMQVCGSWLNVDAGAAEAGRSALPEAQGRRRIQRHSDNLFEYVAVAMPADAGAGIVAGEKHVNEVARLHVRQAGRPLTQRSQPIWNRLGPA